MANELEFYGDPSSDSGATIIARVYDDSGTQVGSDVTCSEIGALAIYQGDMPAAGAGVYGVRFFDSTNLLAQGVINWDGASEITRADTITATGFSTHAAPDLSNLDVAVSTRSNHPAPDLSNLDAPVSSRSSHAAADVWAVTTRTLSSFGTLISDIWSHATRTLSAFSFLVTTDAASRTASQADISSIPTNPLLTNDIRLNNLDATISSRSSHPSPDLSALALESTVNALNNLGAADIDARLTAYDGVTRAEAAADKNEILSAIPTPSDSTLAQQTAILNAVNALNDYSLDQIADAILARGVENVESAAGIHTIAGFILALFESSRSGETFTINRTDGSVFATKTLTLDVNAQPVTGVT